MIREQMIGFLQTVVILLLLINALSIFAAVYAMRMADAFTHPGRGASPALARKLDAILGRCG
jgi:hypothetical protein